MSTSWGAGGLGAAAARRTGLLCKSCNTPLLLTMWTNPMAASHSLAAAGEADRRPTRTDKPSTNLNENTLCLSMLYSICACACVVNVCVRRVPPAMYRLCTCRKLPTSISRRSQPIAMQMLMKILCVCRICPAIVYVGVLASVALSVLTCGYATEHKRE